MLQPCGDRRLVGLERWRLEQTVSDSLTVGRSRVAVGRAVLRLIAADPSEPASCHVQTNASAFLSRTLSVTWRRFVGSEGETLWRHPVTIMIQP
jgi:hypothetical protein